MYLWGRDWPNAGIEQNDRVISVTFSLLFDAFVVLANLVLSALYLVNPPQSDFWVIPPDQLAIPNFCAGVLFMVVAGSRLIRKNADIAARKWAAMALGALVIEIGCFFLIASPALGSLSAPSVDGTPDFSFAHSYSLLANWYVAQFSLDLAAGLFLIGAHRATAASGRENV